MHSAHSFPSRERNHAISFLLALGFAGCGSGLVEENIDLAFEARVGSAPFACGQRYTNVGRTGTTLSPADLRFYVHDLRLVTSTGAEFPLHLDATDHQGNGVALLDFEDGSGDCADSGTPSMNMAITGTAPTGTFTELRFRMGVPAERNHLDVAASQAPLNINSMYWGWLGGYKYLRFEGRTTGQPDGFFFHLGATDCTGLPMRGEPRVCVNGNRPEIRVALPADFTPATHRFVVDVAHWMANVDLDHDQGGGVGCMSDLTDPDCAAYMGTVGQPTASTQTLFQVERVTSP